MATLSGLAKTAIVNNFAYNKFAEVGAMATITLPATDQGIPANATNLHLTTVSGATFEAPIEHK